MSQKTYFIEEVGSVAFHKRRNSKSIKIRINGSNIKVSLPLWIPYSTALRYVNQKKHWILDNLSQQVNLTDGALVANHFRLRINKKNQKRLSSKISGKEIIINLPSHLDEQDTKLQKRINSQIVKILRDKAEEYITPRVRNLSTNNNFTVNSISIKRLSGRWGSCSHKRDLVFNLYLIQLPKDHIDYVIFHELCHTVHLNHSKQFWELVEAHVPNYKQLRREVKNYNPSVITQAK